MTIAVRCSELLIFWRLSLTVHVPKLVKSFFCCIQGQGHSEGSELKQMFAWTISVKLSIVIHDHHHPNIVQKYHFAMFKVKATIVSTISSEILKLL